MILDVDFSKSRWEKGTNETDNAARNIKTYKNTPLQEFYKDQIIFITGGTGFLGKILIEKLLMCCPDIKRIYLLIREKSGKTVEDRIMKLFNDPIFNRVNGDMLKLKKKIIGIPGDCCVNELGLSVDHRNLLKDEVSIIFHVAATIKFDQKLKEAVAINIRSTSVIIDICKNMTNLKSFIHVSTAYSNCFRQEIEEKFYDYSLTYDQLLNLTNSLSDHVIDSITPQLMSSWPNTYTFTKALTEDLIRSKNMNLNIGIFRPGIVIPPVREPIPGWIDNYNGPNGIVASILRGAMRTMHCKPETVANIVPVDLTINALIASAWDVAQQTKRRGENMLIYNYTSTVESPISWGTVYTNIIKNVRQYPFETSMWYLVMRLTKHKPLFIFYAFFLHWIPAYLMDGVARIQGKKPRFKIMYKKIHKMISMLSFFVTNEWNFKNYNVQNMWNNLDSRDREIFQFTMHNFDWSKYFEDYIKGIRIFLLKDNLDSLESSRARYKKLHTMHRILVIAVNFFLLWILYRICIFCC